MFMHVATDGKRESPNSSEGEYGHPGPHILMRFGVPNLGGSHSHLTLGHLIELGWIRRPLYAAN